MMLETLVHYTRPLQLGETAQHCIIWLHGLGADNRDFLDLIPYLQLDNSQLIKFIFPQAPNRAITANGYMVMPAWYDITGWDFHAKHIQADFVGMQESIRQIHELIQHEINQGVLPEKIIVGGFSQGGVIGLLSGLTYQYALSGIFGLSCYLPNLKAFEIALPLKTPQIFMAHGIRDQIVPYFMGETANEQLRSVWGATTEWHAYPIEHTISLEESRALGAWIKIQMR